MNYQNCASCNQSNPSEMRFCSNCGTEFIPANSNLPPTVFGSGVNANQQSGQTPPNFPPQSPPNFQQPNFQPPMPDLNQSPPNFPPPNFQTPPQNFQPQPSFQPSYQSAPSSSGGQAKKVLLGIGGVLIGFIMLASGGVKLYRAFGGSNNKPTPYSSPTPQNLFSNTNNGVLKTSPTPSSTIDSVPRISGTIASGVTYEGTGKNLTLNKAGTYKLKINKSTDAGVVEGQFTAFDGTERSIFVAGTISSSGKLLLEGTDDDYSVAINGTVTKHQIPMGSRWIYRFTVSAGYAFVDKKMKTESGNFVVSY